MGRGNESLFAASGLHDLLVSFSPISNIDKKIKEYVSSHTENSAQRSQAFYTPPLKLVFLSRYKTSSAKDIIAHLRDSKKSHQTILNSFQVKEQLFCQCQVDKFQCQQSEYARNQTPFN